MLEESILDSTKKMLGLANDYTVFDHEVLININSVFSHLYQIGIGVATPIEDNTAVWDDLGFPVPQLNMIKTFIFLKVKYAFDPPNTAYFISAAEKQIEEQEWRLKEFAHVDFST